MRELHQLLERLNPSGAAPRLQWIQATVGPAIQMTPVDKVLFFINDEKYTRVQSLHPGFGLGPGRTQDQGIITKDLGDYTNVLPARIKAGDKVTVEGSYGRFTFDDGNHRQIWIGGGIGITPFIARMKELDLSPGKKPTDLIHSVKQLEPPALALLKADAAAAPVTLQMLVEGEHRRPSGDRLRQLLPDWTAASIWFFGPAEFGAALRADLIPHGLVPKDFPQELFNMRWPGVGARHRTAGAAFPPTGAGRAAAGQGARRLLGQRATRPEKGPGPRCRAACA